MKNKRKPLRKAKTSKNKINYYKHKFMLQKYNTTPDDYNAFIINGIIFNNNLRTVSNFKDYLIFDDPNDFFRRFYYRKESLIHLKYYISFYEENNKIFPNYFSLPESKYLYMNIQLKQNILNNIENQNYKLNKKRQSFSTIFSSSIKRSIYNESQFPSNSITSNGDEEIKKLISNLSKNYSGLSYINKNEIFLLNDESIKKLYKKELIQNKVEKFIINKNNLSSNNKISLLSTERENNLDEKEKEEDHDVKIYLLDKLNKINANDKDLKHKRIMTNNTNELKSICKYAKDSKEKVKSNKKVESKEKIQKILQKMKLFFKNDNNKNKTIIIKDIDNTNNNDNIKVVNTSKNNGKKIKMNSKIFKSVINSNNNQITKNGQKINKREKLKKSNSKPLRTGKDYNIFNRVIPHKLSSKRKDCKTNDTLLYNLNKNSRNSSSNFNILTETSKKNACYSIVSNNNSLSFNSPFIRKKIENKLKSTESYPRFRISAQKKLKRKLLINNCLNGKKKTISELYHNNNRENKNNKTNKSNNNIINDSKNYLKDFSTQTNFRNNNSKQEIKKNKYIKDFITPKKVEKNKENKNEKIFSIIKKNYKKIIDNKKNNNNVQKKTKYALKTRNSTILNSFNINFSNVNQLKILNNLYTTINIYDLPKNKNRSRNSIKTERINSKIISETNFNDNNKLNKNENIINDYKNKIKLSSNNNNIIKRYIDLTHSKRNLTDLVFFNNKTTNNFNSLLNKKNILHNSTSNYFKKNKKLIRKKLRPTLIKKLKKEIILPQNPSRISTLCNKDISKSKNEEIGSICFNNIKKEIRLSSTNTRQLSTDDKKRRAVTEYSISEQNNKKKHQKIKLKTFKHIFDNINNEKK